MSTEVESKEQELKKHIESFCIERGLDQDEVISAIEKAIAGAFRKELGNKDYNYEAKYDLDEGTYSVWRTRTIVDECLNPEKEIALVEARLENPSAQLGDELKEDIEDDKKVEFGRIASQVAKQVLIYTVNNFRHTKILQKYKDKIGELVSVEVDGFKKGGYIVKFAGTSGFISKEDLLPIDRFKPGQIIKALVVDITEDRDNNSRIILSRSNEDFIRAIIKQEVPEVEAGIVNIERIAREPGVRTKILVAVADEDDNQNIDPVGTILGRKNIRILNIMREISTSMQEKVDVVEYHPDNVEEMVEDTLEPAEIEKISFDKDEYGDNIVNVYCYPEEASLAVGRRGANVRLASKLLDLNLKINALEDDGKRDINKEPTILAE